MRILPALAALALAMVPGLARAETVIIPSVTNGYGTLALAVTSIPISGLTAGPSSGAYPAGMPLSVFSVRNSVGSANTLFVCLYGGTCTAANGIPLAVGESKTWNLGGKLTAPTVISGGTATAIVEW